MLEFCVSDDLILFFMEEIMKIFNCAFCVLFALLLVVGLVGCQGANGSWQADDLVYNGRPGLLLEVKTGGFGLYVGGDGQLNAKGSAEGEVPKADPPQPDPPDPNGS